MYLLSAPKKLKLTKINQNKTVWIRISLMQVIHVSRTLSFEHPSARQYLPHTLLYTFQSTTYYVNYPFPES